jgi:hypothetical protein
MLVTEIIKSHTQHEEKRGHGKYNNLSLPQDQQVIFGLHLDRRPTWRKHIFTKRKQLGMTIAKMY